MWVLPVKRKPRRLAEEPWKCVMKWQWRTWVHRRWQAGGVWSTEKKQMFLLDLKLSNNKLSPFCYAVEFQNEGSGQQNKPRTPYHDMKWSSRRNHLFWLLPQSLLVFFYLPLPFMSLFHTEAQWYCCFPKHISFPWLFYPNSPHLAWTSLEIPSGWKFQKRKCHNCYSLNRLKKKPPSAWIPLSFCLEFVSFLKMNKLVFSIKNKVLYIPSSMDSFMFIAQIIPFCKSRFLSSLHSKPLYLNAPPPTMWLSHDHMLLCIWLLVTTLAYCVCSL